MPFNNYFRSKISLFFMMCLVICCQDSELEKQTDELFQRNIRSTDPLTPDEERLKLRVPPGFEVQLFASEPDIGKPLNMSFDSRGRMWLTQSFEYPFPDTTGVGRDQISILEDTDGDGRADIISVFADSLNIPIGIQVVPNGVIAYSIPSILHLQDHDGDDRVDERKILYSGFRHEDTHGMVNNFVRSWDGWIHADHGFSNTSTVAGSDGDTIVMFSGNTFRFRMDGSHLEFTTTGRVNPYGYAYDELAYTYSTDCHTSPIYQLIRGADYPHFGKKPTGIGFGPAVMDHNYGSTALAGLDYYIANQFPQAYQRNFYYGDVVLSRVSRSNFKMHGTTPIINQEEDFIQSEDPWFRPVDIKLGPDGALYVADFYNRIIGHYEVSLDHPGRDRQRGRIWRIVYSGMDSEKQRVDWSEAPLADLLENLDHPNLPLRMSLADQIVDRFGKDAIAAVKALASEGKPPYAYIQGLWILYRLDATTNDLLSTALEAENDTVKVHALRIIFELDEVSPELLQQIRNLSSLPNPHIQRQAVMVMSKHPDTTHVPLLLQLLQHTDQEDTHFYYSIRQSLRDQLRSAPVLDWAEFRSWSDHESDFLADVMLGVESDRGAVYILKHLSDGRDRPTGLRAKLATYAARLLPLEKIDTLINVLQTSESNDADDQYKVFIAMVDGLDQAGVALTKTGKEWAINLAEHFLDDPVDVYAGWQTLPLEKRSYGQNNWLVVDTNSVSTKTETTYLSSGPMNGVGRGASKMRSPTFKMPTSLVFDLRGKKNDPSDARKEEPPSNWVILKDAKTDSVLRKEEINSPNFQKQINWSQIPENNEVYLELHDGSNRQGEYIAISNPGIPGLRFPSKSPALSAAHQIFACEIISKYEIPTSSIRLQEILHGPAVDMYARAASAQALLTSTQDASITADISRLIDGEIHPKLRELLILSLSTSQRADGWKAIAAHFLDIPYQAQMDAVMNIGETRQGIDFVLEQVDQLNINPRLLVEPQIEERFRVNMNKAQEGRFEIILGGMKPYEAQTDELINNRLRNFRAATYSGEKGQVLFSVFCSVCHPVDGQGADIGPQLDGIANWGSQALAEKILDPNRNISKAFKTYTIKLRDGRIQSGLLRREEGESVIFANEQGQEFSLNRNDIVEQSPSLYTLMPNHFDKTIPEEDFNHLLTYLLELE